MYFNLKRFCVIVVTMLLMVISVLPVSTIKAEDETDTLETIEFVEDEENLEQEIVESTEEVLIEEDEEVLEEEVVLQEEEILTEEEQEFVQEENEVLVFNGHYYNNFYGDNNDNNSFELLSNEDGSLDLNLPSLAYEDARAQLSEMFVAHNSSLSLLIEVSNIEDVKQFVERLIEDSIGNNNLLLNVYYIGSFDNQLLQLNVSADYRTSIEQENEFENVLNEVVYSLNVFEESEYVKVKAINNYIYENIVLVEDDNPLNYTAYAALVNKAALNQAYAMLFNKMANLLGLQAYYVSGLTNNKKAAWNIVKVDEKYYFVDTALNVQNENEDLCLLKGSEEFVLTHIADNPYELEISVNDYVLEEETDEIEVITVTNNELVLNIDETYTLELNKDYLINDLLENVLVEFSSSNLEVATIDENALISALAIGETDITIKYGEYTKTIKLFVKEKDDLLQAEDDSLLGQESNAVANYIYFDKYSVDLYVNEYYSTNVVVNPDNAHVELSYSSSDKSVVTVDSKGKLKGIKTGTASVTVTDGVSGKTNTCNIRVYKSSSVPIDSLNFEETKVYLKVGEKKKNKPIFVPVDASDKTLTYEVNNSYVASIASDGTLTGLNPGSTTVVAYGNDKVRAQYNVVVIEEDVIPATKIELFDAKTNKKIDSAISLKVGTSMDLKYVVTPSNANQDITTSFYSDIKSAEVLPDNIIRVTASDTVTSTYYCTVTVQAGGYNGASTSASFKVYDDKTYHITYDYNDGTDRKFIAEQGTYPNRISGDPSKEFVGWYDHPTKKTRFYTSEELYQMELTSDITVYAHYDDCYVITFDPNGGRFSYYSENPVMSVIKGRSCYIGNVYSDSVIPVSGKTFDGWYYDKECTRPFEYTESNFIPTKDLTLYAGYTTYYKVTLDAGIGVFNASNKNTAVYLVKKGNTLNSSTNSSTPAYSFNLYDLRCADGSNQVFVGWFTDKTYKTEVSNVDRYVPKKDVTLYAKWSKDTYSITLNAGDHATFDGKKTKVLKVEKGHDLSNLAQFMNPYVNESGYYLEGQFYTDKALTKKIDNIYTYKPTSNMTIYPGVKKSCKLTFNLNGGVDEKTGSNELVYYSIPDNYFYPSDFLDSAKITNGNKVIEGWYLDKQCTKFAGRGFNFTIKANGDATYYAKWITGYYTITLDGNGENFWVDGSLISTMKIKVPKGFTIIDSNDYTHTYNGYNGSVEKFSTNKDGSGEVNVYTYKPTKNQTLYGNWSYYVSAVNITNKVQTMQPGQTHTLKLVFDSSKAKDKKVTWASSDKTIATVDSSGKVTAKKNGEVTITVTYNNNDYAKDSVEIKVTDEVAKSITLNKDETNIAKGKSETLTATVLPSDLPNKKVTWSSSNEAVATVSTSGKVTAKKYGTATITAKTTDGSNLSATCEVNVINDSADLSGLKTKITFIRNVLEGVTFDFDKVDNALSYEIYRKDNKNNKTYSLHDTTSSTTYTDTDVVAGITYYYQIKAVNSKSSSQLSEFKKICYLSAPELKSITNVAKGVKLTYTKVEGSSWYRVYRRANGESDWTKLGQTTKLTYTDTTAVSGVTYQYIVRSIRGSYYSGVINSLDNKICFLATPELKTVKKESNGIKLSYSKVDGATKYYIYRKDNKNNTSYSKIAETTSLTYTDTTAIKGVTYTYVIKARRGSYTSEKSNALKLAYK